MTDKHNLDGHAGERSGIMSKKRIAIIKFLIVIVPLLLSMKFYTGPGEEWIRHYFGAVVFIILASLLIQLVFQSLRIKRILFSVFLLASALELLQHFFPALFSALNNGLFNQSLLGTHFSLHKIPYYGVGAFIGYYILKSCDK